jgi:hypothetical protein
VISVLVYSFISRYFAGIMDAFSRVNLIHTACWQALYVYTFMSIVSIGMRPKCIIYWLMLLSGSLFIAGFFIIEPSVFKINPWFLGENIDPLGVFNMILFRIVIAVLIILTALNILPLSDNKKQAIKRIIKRIQKDTVTGSENCSFRYSDQENIYNDLKPVISATNMIRNRLVIFKDNEIHEIGSGRYSWDSNNELNDIATVANFTCNFPCAFSPQKIVLKDGRENTKMNILDGGILDNLGLWGPLFSSGIYDPYKKVLSVDARNPKKRFKARIWLRIFLKLIGSGVSRIESITVQVAALRNNLDWPDKKLAGFYFGHVDMAENDIEDIMGGLYKAWRRFREKDFSGVKGQENPDGLSWVDDEHIKKLLNINKPDKKLLTDEEYFIDKVKDAIEFDKIKEEAYGNNFDTLFPRDCKIVDKIKVNLGPLSNDQIESGIRVAQILTRVVMRVYMGYSSKDGKYI